MGKEKGGRQFLTKIIIIRYLYASVIRSVKFRDNEVSLASQRRNTSHFRTSPSVTRSKLPPLDGEKPISRFFLDWNRMLPWKIYESLLSRRDSFVSKEILGKIFERTTRRFPIFPWNATNFNAGILGSCDLDCDCDSVTNFFLVLCLVWEEFCINFSRIQEFISSNDCITKKHQISGKFKKIEADGNNMKLNETQIFSFPWKERRSERFSTN